MQLYVSVLVVLACCCYSEALGLYSLDLCNNCPAGTYSDITGATSLKACTVSHTSIYYRHILQL
jgi:hypothetical protein